MNSVDNLSSSQLTNDLSSSDLTNDLSSAQLINDLNLEQLTNDVKTLMNEVIDPNNKLILNCTDINSILTIGKKYLVNITTPCNYSYTAECVKHFDSVSKLTRMNNESIMAYFKDMLCTLVSSLEDNRLAFSSEKGTNSFTTKNDTNKLKLSIGKDVIITNSQINITLTLSGGMYLHHAGPSTMCSYCECISKLFFSPVCEKCENDDSFIVVCCDCFSDDKKCICQIETNQTETNQTETNQTETNQTETMWKSVGYPNINIICDICKSSENFNGNVISSTVYDIDLCSECAITEQGIDFIKKYDMHTYPHALLTFNYDFGSVLDWIPIYVDNENNYITICMNNDNLLYKCIAISYKNNRNDYEYTIMNNRVDQLNNTIDGICQLFANLSLRTISNDVRELEMIEKMNTLRDELIKNSSKIVFYNNRESVKV